MLTKDTPRGGGVYVIWLSDTHYYGGRTMDYEGRWYRHFYDLRRGKHKNRHMQAVFNKYGGFEPEAVVFLQEESEQIAAEQAWLDAHFGKPGCVNLSRSANSGMMRGRKHTEESKQRMRDAVTEEALRALIERNKSRVWTPEMRERHAEVHRGFKRSPESIQKQVDSWKAEPGNVVKARESAARNHLRPGEKKSPEAVAKIREAGVRRRGIPRDPEAVMKTAEANRGRKNTPETLAQMSASAKRRATQHPTSHGPETRALISAQQRGRVWVNDGVQNKRVAREEAEALLEGGWHPGRKPRPVGAPHGNKDRQRTRRELESARVAGEKRRGQRRDPEVVEKTAKANRGRRRTAEAVANMKAAGEKRRGRKRDGAIVAQVAAAHRGQERSDDARAKMRQGKARRVGGVLPPDGLCSSSFELLRAFPVDGGFVTVGGLAERLPHVGVGAIRQRLFRCRASGHVVSEGGGLYRAVRL